MFVEAVGLVAHRPLYMSNTKKTYIREKEITTLKLTFIKYHANADVDSMTMIQFDFSLNSLTKREKISNH